MTSRLLRIRRDPSPPSCFVACQQSRPASGTAQEYAVVPAGPVFPLPDGADLELGASIGIPGATAHRALTVAEDGPLRLRPGALRDRTVLVAGGAGAVGNAAIQLARWADATVIATTCSVEKAQLAGRAGAHHVVNTVGWDRIASAAADLNRAIDDGAFRIGDPAGLPVHRFALEETHAAHDAVEGGAIGKVLVTVAP